MRPETDKWPKRTPPPSRAELIERNIAYECDKIKGLLATEAHIDALMEAFNRGNPPGLTESLAEELPRNINIVRVEILMTMRARDRYSAELAELQKAEGQV